METLEQTLRASPVTPEQVEILRAIEKRAPFVTLDDPDDAAWIPVDALLTYGCVNLITSTEAQPDGTPQARIVEISPWGRQVLRYKERS